MLHMQTMYAPSHRNMASSAAASAAGYAAIAASSSIATPAAASRPPTPAAASSLQATPRAPLPSPAAAALMSPSYTGGTFVGGVTGTSLSSSVHRALLGPRGCRKVSVRDLLASPLAPAASAAAQPPSHAPSLHPSHDSGFVDVTLSFGAPACELACVNVLGTLSARLGESDPQAAHFTLEDSSGHIRVTLPLALMFAALPLQAKGAVRGGAPGSKRATSAAAASLSCASLLASPSASPHLPAVGRVLEVSGVVQLCSASNTRRVLATAYQLLPAHPLSGLSAVELVKERARELHHLYETHFFRALHMPPPPPVIHTPQRQYTPVTTTGNERAHMRQTTPTGAASPLRVTPTATFHPTTPFAASHASPPRPLGGRLVFDTPVAAPRPASSAGSSLASSAARPSSYLDEFTSSQEERAHVAAAEQLADKYMQQKQQQQQQQQQQRQQAHVQTQRGAIAGQRHTTPVAAPRQTPASRAPAASNLPRVPPSPVTTAPSSSGFVAPRRVADPAAAAALAARIAAMSAAATAAPPADAELVGFSSGLGNSLKPSEAAMLKAKQMQEQWNKEADGELGAPEPAHSASSPAAATASALRPPFASPSHAAPRAHSPRSPSFGGAASPPTGVPADFDPSSLPSFTSGHGRAVQVSEAAKAKAAQLFRDMEEKEEQMEQQERQADEARTPVKHTPAPHTAAAAGSFAGGFSGAKPFKPPASTRPPPPRSSASTVSSPAAAAAIPSRPTPPVAAAPRPDMDAIRKAKRDALDKQLEEMERGMEQEAQQYDSNANSGGFGAASFARSSTSDSPSVSPSFGFSSSAQPPAADLASSAPGFQTGHGRQVSVSEEARRKAEQRMREMEAEDEAAAAEATGGAAPFRTPAKKTTAMSNGAAAAAGFQTGGFSTGAKPFRPPAMVRTPAARAAMATASPSATTVPSAILPAPVPAPASIPVPVPAVAAASVPVSAADARRARLALLDKQIEDMESGAASFDEEAAVIEFGTHTSQDEAGGSYPPSPVGFAKAGATAAVATAGFGTAKAMVLSGFGAASAMPPPHSPSAAVSEGEGESEEEETLPSMPLPLVGHKRKSLSQIPEESVGAESGSGTQPLASQPYASQFASQLSQPIIISARTLPPTHPTSHSTPVPVVPQVSDGDWWPALPTPTVPAASIPHTSTVAHTSTSPMPALAAPSPSSFASTSPPASAVSAFGSAAATDDTLTLHACKRARLSGGEEVQRTPAAPAAASTHAPHTPIPIGSFQVAPTPSPAHPLSPSPVRSSAATASASAMDSLTSTTGAPVPRDNSPSSGSQIFIPATPSLESQPMPSLDSQFDAAANDNDNDDDKENYAGVQDFSKGDKRAALEPLPAHVPNGRVAPSSPQPRERDMLLPPTPEDVLPPWGSPAALRARTAARVATFSSPAPPPSCSSDHVLFSLRDILTTAAAVPQLALPDPHAVSMARLWQRTELLLTDEYAEGEVQRTWSADKRDTFAKLKPQWGQQFEKVLIELQQERCVHLDRSQQRVRLLRAL